MLPVESILAEKVHITYIPNRTMNSSMFPYYTYKFKNYILVEPCDEFIVRAEHRQLEHKNQK